MRLHTALAKSNQAYAYDGSKWVAKRQGLGVAFIQTWYGESEEDNQRAFCRYHSFRFLKDVPDYFPRSWHVRKAA